MAGFRIQLFKGIRPRISARKLPGGEAQTAQNAKLGSGDLEAWDEKDAGTAVDKTWYTKTVYRFDNNGSPVWFEWTEIVDVARGPIKDDSLERTYYTGDGGVPKMTYTTIADAGGGGPYPEGNRDLGIPQPPNAPSGPIVQMPDSIESSQRTFGSVTCDAFLLDLIIYNVHPGTGTDANTWRRRTAVTGTGSSRVLFEAPPGSRFLVKRVVGDNQAVLESADKPGLFARGAASDNAGWRNVSGFANQIPMGETGSTKEATFAGWIIPEATVTFGSNKHFLEEGDIIEITSTSDGETQLRFPIASDLDFYEQSWPSTSTESFGYDQDGEGNYEDADVETNINVRVAASATEGEAQFTIQGNFSYNVVETGGVDLTEINETIQDRQYVFTYVSNLLEEGPPSAASPIINTRKDGSIVLTGFPNVFTEDNLSNRDIDWFYIYRTNSSEAGTEFQFVGKVGTGSAALPTTTFVDTVADGDLGEALETATWFPPDADMEGIITLPNGILAGFKGKTVFLTEPYFPHAWPPEYDQAVKYDIVGLASIGNSVVVLTKGHPAIITGSHPRNMNVRAYNLNQACENKESIATDGDRVYYASPDGLVEISVNGARLVTEPYALKDEWASYVPKTMVGEFYDGKYFGFHGDTGDTGSGGESAVTQAPVTVTLAGTLTSGTDEADIQAGGQVLTITISGATWEDAGAAFNAERQNIIDSLDSDKSETNGWDAERSNIPVTDVVRTSATVVTITLSALANYEISVAETLTMTLPPSVFKATEPADNIIVSTTIGIDVENNFSSKAIFITDTGFWGYSSGDSPANGAQHCMYDNLRSRWLIAVGSTVPTSKPVTYTSTDDANSWQRTEAFDNVYTTPGQQVNFVHYYPEYDVVLASLGQTTPLGNGPSAIFSKDGGSNWSSTTVDSVGGNEAISGEQGFETLNGTFFAPAYKSATDAPKLVVAPAANPQNNWPVETMAIDGTELDMLDTIVCGNGKAIYAWLSDIDNDIEIGYYDPTDQSHTSIGVLTNSGATALFSAFGNDVFMIMQTDSSFTTVAADGSETTIGNWAAMGGATANFVVSNLYYDGGDGVTAGWGWVACGTNSSTNKGVIYTSNDDGATWTLRHTTSANAVILSMAFNNYTSDLDKS
jgi:hypothetical protein